MTKFQDFAWLRNNIPALSSNKWWRWMWTDSCLCRGRVVQVCLVQRLAATWDRPAFNKWTGQTLAMALPLLQHHEHCQCLWYYYYGNNFYTCQVVTEPWLCKYPFSHSFSMLLHPVTMQSQQTAKLSACTLSIYISAAKIIPLTKSSNLKLNSN